MNSSPAPEDPSRLTKFEVRNRMADTVAAIGELAKLTCKSAESAPLQAAISSFAAHEKTVASTDGMLQRINLGLADLEEALDEVSAALRPTSSRLSESGSMRPNAEM